jgi:hypothetical protein
MEEKKSGEIKKYQNEILPAEAIRSEVNFLTFPYFSLWDKDLNERRKLELTITTRRNNLTEEIYWGVYAHQDYGFPGPFDKKVHMAIEQIISELPLPISNPIPLGSFRSIASRMGLSGNGVTIRNIKKSLERIVHTAINSKKAFYDKSRNRWIESSFHLYDQVVFVGEDLVAGGMSDNNFVYLSDWYMKSINARYVKPIDWAYIRQLELPIAGRLYELLGVKFYGLGPNDKFIRYKYSTLCDLLPVRRQKYLSYAKRIMNPALDKLKDTGFLADFTWQETYLKKTNGKDKDWYIIFYPGERATNEIKAYRSERLQLEEYSVSRLEEISSTIEEELKEALMSLNVSPTVADELIGMYNVEIIGSWISEVSARKGIKDKAAYLVKALREGWNLPERKVKAIEKAKAETIEEAKCEEIQFDLEEEHVALDHLYDSLSDDDKREIEVVVEERIPPLARSRILKGDTDTHLVRFTLSDLRRDITKEWLGSGRLTIE